eukprot:GEMP01027078.1.p1 GENE.GEMP01027078.1~~GEMP01027078.1.p1  ORF type:complete len:421 (+),score=83.95 GEMP01027078.1:123-1385(+)
MAMLVAFGFFLAADAAAADVPLTCHVVGSSREFPLGSEELNKRKSRIAQATLMYKDLADLPSAALAFVRETTFATEPSFIAETATREHVAQLIKHYKELYPTNKAPFAMEIENSQFDQVKFQVTINELTYEVQEFLAEGSTGYVYRAVQRGDAHLKPYAVKFSKKQRNPRMRANAFSHHILHEFKAMRILRDHPQVPHAYAMAKIIGTMEPCTVMVSDFIGPDLYSLAFKAPGGALSLEDTLHYGVKLVGALRQLHTDYRLLHHDIKPGNIAIKDAGTGLAKDNELFLIDFGSASYYISADGQHLPYRGDAGLAGTTSYISLRADRQQTRGRQDDMFATLLSLMRVEGSYNRQHQAARRRDMANFDKTWLATRPNTIPTPFLKFWRATYNPVLGDEPRWQERPQYEMVLHAFQEELDRIR